MPPPRLKRSNTANSTPASLEDGEIAINQSDGKLYYHTAAGGVASFSALPSADSTMTGVLTVQPTVPPAVPGGSIQIIGENQPAIASIYQYSSTSQGQTGLYINRMRGTKAAPEILQAGDSLSGISWNSITTTGARAQAGYIICQCTQTPSAGDTTLRSQLSFSAADGSSQSPVFTITNAVCNFANSLTVGGTAVVVSSDSRLTDARTPTDGSVTTAKLAAGAVSTANIANSAVTYAKVQNVSATDRLLGRSTAGAGVVEEIPCTAFARTLLNDATATEARATLGLGTAFDGGSGSVSAPTFTFTSDPNTGVYSPGTNQLAVSTDGAQRMVINATGDIGIGTGASENIRLSAYNAATNVLSVGHQMFHDPISTVSGAYANFGAYYILRTDVAAGVTDAGAKRGIFASVQRNNKTTNNTDAGTLTYLRGGEIQYGHGIQNTAIAPTTTQVVGLFLTPLAGYGTITDMYDLYISGTLYGLGTITNHWAMYQASAAAKNYFAGNVGIGVQAPAVKLDVSGSIRGSGILFGSDTAAASTLSDYEEGTWTPSYTGSTTAPTCTYSLANGSYVKVGRLVSVQGRIILSAVTGGSGSLLLSGLPFAVASGSGYGATGTTAYRSNWTTQGPTGMYAVPSTNTAILSYLTTTGFATNTPANLSSTCDLIFSLSYISN
jgi:hypothetical protein